ncbi:MAG: hypothetical protein CMB71_05360 [Euryarchaeota archaeon]|nr:hypothetical protein [Euryarchaeota archaeon]
MENDPLKSPSESINNRLSRIGSILNWRSTLISPLSFSSWYSSMLCPSVELKCVHAFELESFQYMYIVFASLLG